MTGYTIKVSQDNDLNKNKNTLHVKICNNKQVSYQMESDNDLVPKMSMNDRLEILHEVNLEIFVENKEKSTL